jgi:hypothetical protein
LALHLVVQGSRLLGTGEKATMARTRLPSELSLLV